MSVSARIDELFHDPDLREESIRNRFGALTEKQINWKPGADRWSVAQCFQHLITTNEQYFDLYDRIIKGWRDDNIWTRIPFLPGFFGRTLKKSLAPDSPRKFKVPVAFEPVSSGFDITIIDAYLTMRQNLISYMNALKDRSLDHIYITSPAARFVTYSALDALEINALHDKRHLAQAEHVMTLRGFPSSGE